MNIIQFGNLTSYHFVLPGSILNLELLVLVLQGISWYFDKKSRIITKNVQDLTKREPIFGINCSAISHRRFPPFLEFIMKQIDIRMNYF